MKGFYWMVVCVIFFFACQSVGQEPEQACVEYITLKDKIDEYLTLSNAGPLDRRFLEHIDDENKWKAFFQRIEYVKRIDSLMRISLKEPFFENTADDYEAFRLTHWAAFREYELLVRVENVEGFVKLVHKKFENNPFGEKNGEPAYKMISEDSLILKNLTWKELYGKFQEEEFWELIYDDGVECLDGESWTIEGVTPRSNFKDEKHIHTINRSCPDETQTVVVLGQYLFDLVDTEL